MGDDADAAIRTRNSLFCQLINEPCYDTLRTKEQLGYLVHSSGRAGIGMTGFRISIQSERDASYLEQRIDSFLASFEKYLEDMSENKFEQEKGSLVNRLKEDFKNLYQETGTYWSHIHSGYYDFERKAKDAALISKLSKKDILDFYKEKISPKSTTRAKISVHLQSQHLSKANIEAIPSIFSEHGSEVPADVKAVLESPLPLFEEVVAKIGEAGVKAKIRESHLPSRIGEGKELFEDAKAVREKMLLGPPASPVSEYVRSSCAGKT